MKELLALALLSLDLSIQIFFFPMGYFLYNIFDI